MPGATFKLVDAFAAFAVRVADGAMTANGSNPRILTSATAAFKASDVNKKVKIEGAGAAGADLVTTIAKRISATQVELKAPALTTVVGSDISFVKGVYRLSTLLQGADVDGNTYQYVSLSGRMKISLESDSPGGSLFIGGPWLSPTNYGIKIGAAEADDMQGAVIPSSDYITSDTANQLVHIYWSDDLNQSTGA